MNNKSFWLTLVVLTGIFLSACKQEFCYCSADDGALPADSVASDSSASDSVASDTIASDTSKTDTVPVTKVDSNGVIKTRTFKVGGVSFKMCLVPNGYFYMGAQGTRPGYHNYDDNLNDTTYAKYTAKETPCHTVSITKDYAMGEYLVTQELWKAVMRSNYDKWIKLGIENNPQYPASFMFYNDIVNEFLPALNDSLHKNGQLEANLEFRLPTEAQWEFAARGGYASNYIYAGSDVLTDVSSDGYSDVKPYTVGCYKPNELGLYDMSGNVWEWCSDYFGTYSGTTETDPTGPASNDDNSHVIRGGGFNSNAIFRRVSARYGMPQTASSYDTGFRLCLVYKW